jgi:hypothetical protein
MKNTKNRALKGTSCTLLFLLSAFVFLASALNPYALPETTVKLEPALCSAGLGQTFVTNITVADVQNLYGLEVDVFWNASVLEIAEINVRVGQADGALYSSVYIAENSTADSQYTLAATSVAPAPPFNGTGTAVTITFRVKDHGNSSLSATSQLYDFPPPDRYPRESLPIEHITLGSTFEETVPEIGGPLMLMTLALTVFIVVLFLRKRGSLAGQKAINAGSQQGGW